MLEFIISNFGYFDLIIFVSLLLLGFVINLLGVDKKKIRIGFLYNVMPSMKPIRIETKGKGFWKGIWMWLTCTREWELTRDWHFSIGSTKYIIPKGFTFNGASVPKFLTIWFSPVGVLFLGALVHDFLYAYEYLVINENEKRLSDKFSRKKSDLLFREICIEQNGFHVMNYLAYYSLRLFGFISWNKHRKNRKTLQL